MLCPLQSPQEIFNEFWRVKILKHSDCQILVTLDILVTLTDKFRLSLLVAQTDNHCKQSDIIVGVLKFGDFLIILHRPPNPPIAVDHARVSIAA